MGKIRPPISKPITSVQVNDITIFMKLKYRSAMSFGAILGDITTLEKCLEHATGRFSKDEDS